MITQLWTKFFDLSVIIVKIIFWLAVACVCAYLAGIIGLVLLALFSMVLGFLSNAEG